MIAKPFPLKPRYGLSFSEVYAYAPAGPGVYAVYSSELWVYIAPAENIQKHLLALLNGVHAVKLNCPLDGFIARSMSYRRAVDEAHQLDELYQPIYNRLPGHIPPR